MDDTHYAPQRASHDLGFSDITHAIALGWADFKKAPLMALFFGAVFVCAGWVILASLYVLDMPYLALPVAMGFPLVGPFVAIGLYEISHKLSQNQPVKWREILGVPFDKRATEIIWMAFVTLFIFWVWIYQVRLLMALFLGWMNFSTLEGFLQIITTTQQGYLFLGVGTLVGAILSLVLFCTTAMSIPMMLDKPVDIITAIITSFKTVIENPLPMLGYGIIIALCTFFALVPAFLGLLIVLPLFGFSTWHLYKRAVI